MNRDKLIKGKVYFMCSYENPRKPIPQIQALVYLGKNLFEKENSDGDEYIFYDPQIYFITDVTAEDVKAEILSAAKGSWQVTVPEDCIHTVKSYDDLLEWLKMLKHSEGADQLYKEILNNALLV